MNYQNNLSEVEEQTLMLHPSRQKVLLLFVGSLVLVAAGIFILPQSRDWWKAGLDILATVICGLGALSFLLRLLRPFPLLQVSDEGFHQWSFWGKSYFISWEEIAFIFLGTGRLSSSLNIYLSEAGLATFSTRYPWRGAFCRLFGRLVLVVSSVMSPVPVQEILETMQKRYRQQIERFNIYVR